MRKRLFIVGARGAGREAVNTFRLWNGFEDQYEIAGFLDSKADALDGFSDYPPIRCAPEDYIPEENDVVLCALGIVKWRKQYIDLLLSKGARFETFIAPTAMIHRTAKIGIGCQIGALTTISSDVTVGDFVMFHPYCDIGHDTQIGTHSIVETYTFCGGFASIGKEVTLHTRSTILPHIKVGDGATVGAGSVVLRNVKANTTVFGNPAKKIEI